MSDQTDVDLCVDCVAVEMNGEDALEDAGWPGFLESWRGWSFAPSRCGGEDVDDLWCEGHSVPPGRACEGCGSGLGGTRFCYTAFLRAGSARSGSVSGVDAGLDLG